MPRKEKENTFILSPQQWPSLTDCFGVEIEKGDIIVYPLRQQAQMWIAPALVRSWNFRKRINWLNANYEEVYCNLRVWILSEEENKELKPRKTIITSIERIVKLNPDGIQNHPKIKALLEMPVEED